MFAENENEITKEKIQEVKNNIRFRGGVIAVNLETLEVSRFESQSEAGYQLGFSSKSINRVLKDKLNKTHGFWFCYANSIAVEKTREKFGDTVAEKVEELMKCKWNQKTTNFCCKVNIRNFKKSAPLLFFLFHAWYHKTIRLKGE